MNDAAKIRKATSRDVRAIAAMVEAAYQPYIARIGKPPGPMLDDYVEVVRRHRVVVIEYADAKSAHLIVGALVLIESPRQMLLDNIAVHPDWQGRGIGRRLLEYAEAETRRLGFAQLTLYTHECMTENIAMYQRAGYAVTERRCERGYRRVYMAKVL